MTEVAAQICSKWPNEALLSQKYENLQEKTHRCKMSGHFVGPLQTLYLNYKFVGVSSSLRGFTIPDFAHCKSEPQLAFYHHTTLNGDRLN